MEPTMIKNQNGVNNWLNLIALDLCAPLGTLVIGVAEHPFKRSACVPSHHKAGIGCPLSLRKSGSVEVQVMLWRIRRRVALREIT